MKKFFGIMLFCSFFVKANHVVSIEGFQSPQAIAATNLHVFVSNAGDNANLLKNGNGFISKLDRTGKIVALNFIGNLNAPHGMAILDTTLYVVDIDTLKGFNLNTKKQILNFPISGATLLSDVVVKDSTSLLVADSESGLILLIDLKKKNYHTFVTIENNMGALQNMALSDTFLYATSFDKEQKKGRVLRINLETKEVEILYELKERLHGISTTKAEGIIVAATSQNNEGKLYKITPHKKLYRIEVTQNLQAPAKFWHDTQTLWIPDSLSNKVEKIVAE